MSLVVYRTTVSMLSLAPHPDEPMPLTRPSAWIGYAGPLMAVAILAAVFAELRAPGLRASLELLPTRPRFWVCFAAYYLAGPAAEWVIFRRLWALPARGALALLRKQVSNELVLGYSGELSFYAWARSRARFAAAPFGAIKDVAVLSAGVGNALCLVTAALAWPLLSTMNPGARPRGLFLAVAVVLLFSALAILFRRRLFTLAAPELRHIALVHTIRAVSAMLLAAAMWHILLPHVGLSCWVVLAALRQAISRLPLLPGKDMAFAGAAVALVGASSPIAAATTLVASLLLLAHAVVGTLLALAELAEGRR